VTGGAECGGGERKKRFKKNCHSGEEEGWQISRLNLMKRDGAMEPAKAWKSNFKRPAEIDPDEDRSGWIQKNEGKDKEVEKDVVREKARQPKGGIQESNDQSAGGSRKGKTAD